MAMEVASHTRCRPGTGQSPPVVCAGPAMPTPKKRKVADLPTPSKSRKVGAVAKPAQSPRSQKPAAVKPAPSSKPEATKASRSPPAKPPPKKSPKASAATTPARSPKPRAKETTLEGSAAGSGSTDEGVASPPDAEGDDLLTAMDPTVVYRKRPKESDETMQLLMVCLNGSCTTVPTRRVL